MTDPKARLEDMDLEGIDQTIMFPGGAGEEWAGLDRDFAIALCRTLNDARAEFTRYAPKRLMSVAKLPMIDPDAAAAELRRCVDGARHGRHGHAAARAREEPRRPELRRRVDDGRGARRRGLRARRRPGDRPGADRRRPLEDAARGARLHAPRRPDDRGHGVHGRRHPAPLPEAARRVPRGRHRLAARRGSSGSTSTGS